MGFQFLKHIERTKVIIHIVDVSGSEGRDPKDDFDKINDELAKYSDRLIRKPMIVAANKIDMIEADGPEYTEFREYVESKGYKVFPMSAPINLGVKEVIDEAALLLERAEEEPVNEEPELFDFDRDDEDPDYRKIYAAIDENGDYVLSGKQLKKIFNSTNFNDMGSLRYLYKYIESRGAIKQLLRMGMKEGDTVRIEDFEFEYIDEF
jgi:Obg family GTPase CgtA, C-terminal extension